jgi:hypothetical protein
MKVNSFLPCQPRHTRRCVAAENSNQTLTILKPHPNLDGVYSLLHRLWQKDIHNRASSLQTYSLSPPRARSFYHRANAPLPFPPLWRNPETAVEMGKDHHYNTVPSCSTGVVAASLDTDLLFLVHRFGDRGCSECACSPPRTLRLHKSQVCSSSTWLQTLRTAMETFDAHREP